ncbi:hypothetical protein JHW43_005499 [Diplocarpon mali]|nr:hypothetical protein JHW43_005499 [Diplocarpon mali]
MIFVACISASTTLTGARTNPCPRRPAIVNKTEIPQQSHSGSRHFEISISNSATKPSFAGQVEPKQEMQTKYLSANPCADLAGDLVRREFTYIWALVGIHAACQAIPRIASFAPQTSTAFAEPGQAAILSFSMNGSYEEEMLVPADACDRPRCGASESGMRQLSNTKRQGPPRTFSGAQPASPPNAARSNFTTQVLPSRSFLCVRRCPCLDLVVTVSTLYSSLLSCFLISGFSLSTTLCARGSHLLTPDQLPLRRRTAAEQQLLDFSREAFVEMARDNILLTYLGIDALFLATGGLLMIFALVTKTEIAENPTADNVARDLLFDMCPLNAAIANAVMVFFTFLMTVPAIVLPMTRGWLKVSGYMMVVCALFTMIIGLDIWFETLKTRENLFAIWKRQPASTQSLIQSQFICCGYQNSTSPPFVVDSTCTDALVAAAQGGCVGPLASFANNFLDIIFTGAFGIVGVDAALIIMTAILLKDRKEKERYRHIDEKSGAGAF